MRISNKIIENFAYPKWDFWWLQMFLWRLHFLKISTFKELDLQDINSWGLLLSFNFCNKSLSTILFPFLAFSFLSYAYSSFYSKLILCYRLQIMSILKLLLLNDQSTVTLCLYIRIIFFVRCISILLFILKFCTSFFFVSFLSFP